MCPVSAWNGTRKPFLPTSPVSSAASQAPSWISKHLEILAVLPVRHLGLKPLDLRVLDVDVVIDELRAQRLPEERIVVQREHRFAQALRQKRRLRLIWRIRRRPRIELAVDAIEP